MRNLISFYATTVIALETSMPIKAASIYKNSFKQSFKTGLDPASCGALMDSSKYIQKGDAFYVQTIHSSVLVGTRRQIADSNINVYHNCPRWYFENNHRLSAFLHGIISAKKAIFVAVEKGHGRVIKLENDHYPNVNLASDECVVGVYNKNASVCNEAGKRYEISIHWDDCKTLEKIRLETVG